MANKGINKVIILGNCGKDPEVKTFSNGGSITNISIATSESWKDKNTGENTERTEWHKIVFNGKLSELAANYIVKGSKIYVEGKLKTRKWKDNEGIERYITEIVADTFQLLDSKKESTSENDYRDKNQSSNHSFEDDIPF